MPTAKKQPSGNWKVRVYAYTDDQGKQHLKSFTAPTKREAERLAAQFISGQEATSAPDPKLGDAIDEYISRRASVLSPYTVKDYRNIRRLHAQSLMHTRLSKITQEDLQRTINIEAMSYSPKTVRNVSGLISAVLGVYRPELAYHIDLPQKIRPNITVPGDEEVQMLLVDTKGTIMELAILLAALGPMRRGEICALRMDNIKGSTVHVCENMVQSGSDWIIKQPKTYAGDRYISFPEFVADLFPKEGRVVPLTPTALTRRFQRITKRLGINCRFHDLRHYGASILHTIMPDAYIMQRGGWATDSTLKAVYRHTLDSQSSQYTKQANDYFESRFLKT